MNETRPKGAIEPNSWTVKARNTLSILPDNSLFQFTDITYATDDVSLTWTSNTRDFYKIERSADLNLFIELEDSIQGAGDTTTYIDTAPPAGRAYYRVTRQ